MQEIAEGGQRDATASIIVHSLGVYYYGICVDPVRDEINLNNNCVSERVEVNRKTDLKVSDFVTSATSVEIGDRVTLSAIVHNNGSGGREKYN